MEDFGRDYKIIDIATLRRDWVSSMDNMVFENSLMSSKSCIFVTPKLLSRNNERAYVPTAFAIGPLHHGKPDLEEAEQIKLKYTRDLIRQISRWNNNIVNDLVREIADLEEEARQCYSVPLKFSRDEFAKILLVDGCFLIKLFRKKIDESPASLNDSESPAYIDDAMSSRAFLNEALYTDLFLLENQIPWMVLDRLFSCITLPGANPLTQLAVDYFTFLVTGKSYPETKYNSIANTLGQSKHLLQLSINSLVGSTKSEGGTLHAWGLIPSASSLIEAGVKFKKGSTDGSILDIKFSNGVLEIPPIVIHESTEALFRNMISFEQCYHLCDPRITSYAMLLDILINTPKDMDILSKAGIIQNWLNPEEATQMFNNLYTDTCLTSFYYVEIFQQVNDYCKRRWPRWRAMYVRNHFNSPWAIASQVFAAVIFILALLQTVFSIK